MQESLGPLQAAVDEATVQALALLPRIWDRDHTVWQQDPTEVADRLGWLDAPTRAATELPQLVDLAQAVTAGGVTDVLLVGMGGSSLYPEVLATTVGPAPGHPRLRVLDSTDPAAVLAVEEDLPWTSTLLVASSKSGTTIETRSHLARFSARLRDALGGDAGRRIVVITDPGSDLEAVARAEGHRAVLHGHPDVGGRFSALTPFGLFPAALLGVDLEAHLAPARAMLADAQSAQPASNTPLRLGAVMAAAARAGRDKLVLALPPSLASFGLWVEQLVAESTGKGGQGLLPVIDTSLSPDHQGEDLLVVAVGEHAGLADLEAAGLPVVRLPEVPAAQLAGEVARWAFATAVCGALLGLNPFDQPDVAAAKAATQRILDEGGDLPPTEDPGPLLATVGPGDYVALLGFVTPGGPDEHALRHAAERLRRRLGVPVTVGIGPRYLHSTGQFHKGGPATGVYLLVVGDDPADAEVPGQPYTFGRLKRAQAAGDLAALAQAGRRVVHVSPDALASV